MYGAPCLYLSPWRGKLQFVWWEGHFNVKSISGLVDLYLRLLYLLELPDQHPRIWTVCRFPYGSLHMRFHERYPLPWQSPLEELNCLPSSGLWFLTSSTTKDPMQEMWRNKFQLSDLFSSVCSNKDRDSLPCLLCVFYRILGIVMRFLPFRD